MLSTDGYGNRVLSESTPAYRIYPELGPKMGANGNRNMLTQSAGSAQFKVDAQGNKQGLLAATAQTWSQAVPVIGTTPSSPETRGTQATIWRPQSTYSWLPTNTTANGLTPVTGSNSFTDFFTGGGGAPWKKTAEVTLYDVYSNALEAADVNAKYVATKKGFNQSRVLVSGGPARYDEIAYTGAEEPLFNGAFSGGVRPYWPSWLASPPDVYTESTPTGKTHTGSGSILVRNNQNGVVYEPTIGSIDGTKPYRASVWATSPNVGLYYCVDENTAQAVTVVGRADRGANGWYQINLDIPPIGSGHSSLRVGVWNGTGQEVYVDDFRFQPTNAQTTAYVYDQKTGQVAYLLDNNNLYTRYQYDAAGRLTKVSRETFKYQAKLV